MTLARALPLCLGLLLSSALCAPLTRLPSERAGELLLEGADPLRYRWDPALGAIVLPDIDASVSLALPEGFTLSRKGLDLYLVPPAGAQFGLLTDARRLLITWPLTGTPPSSSTVVSGGTPLTPRPSGPEALLERAPGLLPPTPLVYPLESADPKTVAELLSKFFKNLTIEVDARQHAVVVQVSPEQRPSVEATLKALDQVRPQVMFEAEILEVNRDTTQALGIDYDDIFSFKLLEDAPKGILEIGKLNRASALSFNIGISALKNTGAARVLAQPRITTLDGVEAVINSTQTTPVILTGSSGGSLQSITTGITLRLTPRVTPGGWVEAELVITVSSPTGSTASGVPQFSAREARTTVRVRNGEAIVIGGLIEERQVNSEQKVPGLGDLPLIGELFTTRRIENRRSDLVIIVTPRLVLPTPPGP
jgi:general secretion pathway protein D